MLDPLVEQQQQLKIVQEAHEIEPQRNQPIFSQSPFKEKYLQRMNFKGNSFSSDYLFGKLMDKQITIQQTLSKNQLDVTRVSTSKNYSVIELLVKIGPYQVNINILNNQVKSPIHSLGVNCQGTYGKIYKYTSKSGQEKAVKCIQIKDQLKFQEELFKMINQYALLKIASAVESGPQINFYSFDIFVYWNSKFASIPQNKISQQNCKACLQFQMEYCISSNTIIQQDFQSLYRSLYTLHRLGITHNDVKVDNILFSKSLNKWIFLDYGVSLHINQKIGQSKLVSFRGTYSYSGPEMVKLCPKGTGFVDLYWNDVVGLQISLNQLKKARKQSENVNVFKGNVDVQSHFLMLQLKYYLYFYNFAQIQKKCLQIRWQTDGKRFLFYFLFQLDYFPDHLKKFLGSTIDWETVSTIESINPKQIFGTVTSPLAFKNWRFTQTEAIKQSAKIYFQLANIFLQELNQQKSQIYIKGSNQKKERKKQEKILSSQKEVSIMIQKDEQSYITLIFEYVDFIKCRFGVSLKKKSLFCKVFQSYYTKKQKDKEKLDYSDINKVQLQQFSLQAIYFFFKYLVDSFIESPNGYLLNLFPRIYQNYVMLGLAETQKIQLIYQNIINSNYELTKICQLFQTVYQNKFWYQNVIYYKQNIDFFKIKKSQIQVISQICRKINYRHKQTDHTCSEQHICMQVESQMAQGIINFYKKQFKQDRSIDQRLRKYTQILQILQQNLANKIQAGTQTSSSKQPGVHADKVTLQIQTIKNLSQNYDKLKFESWQIPSNLGQLFTEEFFGIHSEAFCQSVIHLQQIFNLQHITKFWTISVIKNLIYYKESDNIDKAKQYVQSIKSLYQTGCQSSQNLIHYLISLNHIRECLYRLNVVDTETSPAIAKLRDQIISCKKILGDLLTEQEIAEYLFILNEQHSYSIWRYLKEKKDQKIKVKKIISLLADKLKATPCKAKQKIKKLAIEVFSHAYLSKPVTEYSVQQRQRFDDFILTQHTSRQQFFLKIKYMEILSFSIHLQKTKQISEDQQMNRYFVELNKTMAQYQDQEYFLTQKIHFHLFCFYEAYLIKNRNYGEMIRLLQKSCNRIFSYISRQTVYLLLRLKMTLFNYYRGSFSILHQEWPLFRDSFIKQSQKKDNFSLQILNIFIVYLQLIYQQVFIYKGKYVKIQTQKLDFRQKLQLYDYKKPVLKKLPFWKMMLQNYKALKLFDLITIDSKWIEIQLHYRCLFIILNYTTTQRPQKFSKPRFIRSLKKKHKKIIQIILKDKLKQKVQDQLFQQLNFYSQKSQIQIFLKYSKVRFKQLGEAYALRVLKFKEKIKKFFYKQIKADQIKIIYNN